MFSQCVKKTLFTTLPITGYFASSDFFVFGFEVDPTKSTSQTIVSSGDVRFLTTNWFNTSGANQGDLFQDHAAIGGLTLVNYTFGVDMGGGLSTLVSGEMWNQPLQNQPPTLARQMVDQGDIASAAFSLALDRIGAIIPCAHPTT